MTLPCDARKHWTDSGRRFLFEKDKDGDPRPMKFNGDPIMFRTEDAGRGFVNRNIKTGFLEAGKEYLMDANAFLEDSPRVADLTGCEMSRTDGGFFIAVRGQAENRA